MANVQGSHEFTHESKDGRGGQIPPSKKEMYKYAAAMQAMIGSRPVVQVKRFRNWSEGEVRRRVLSLTPTTVEEVRAVVLAARRLGLRVRAAGQSHSWSPLFADEGQVVLYTGELQRQNGRPPIEMAHDITEPGSFFATVAASATSGDFMQFQLDNNVCIPGNVVTRVVQMSGIVSTGSHVKPMEYVETQHIWITVKDLFYNQQNLSNIIHGNWSVFVFWGPFNSMNTRETAEAVYEKSIGIEDWNPLEDEVLVRIVNKVQGCHQHVPDHFYKSQNAQDWLKYKGMQAIDGMLTRHPQTAPVISKTQVKLAKRQFPACIIQRLPYSVHTPAFSESLPVHDMEWSFDMDRCCSSISVGVRGAVEIIQKEALAGRFPVNFYLHMRFLGASQSYLAPMSSADPLNGGPGHTCSMGFETLIGTPNWFQFCENISHLWRQLPGARPHWAKEWVQLSGIDEHLRKSYGRQFLLFLSALQRSGADPDGTFLNDYLENLLYPLGHAGGARRKVVLLDNEEKDSSCALL